MIYILEFDQVLGNVANPRGMARFYIGSCCDGRLDDRLAEHRSGCGASITAAAISKGINFRVVATLPGGRREERRLKNKKNTPKLVAQLRRAGKTLY